MITLLQLQARKTQLLNQIQPLESDLLRLQQQLWAHRGALALIDEQIEEAKTEPGVDGESDDEGDEYDSMKNMSQSTAPISRFDEQGKGGT